MRNSVALPVVAAPHAPEMLWNAYGWMRHRHSYQRIRCDGTSANSALNTLAFETIREQDRRERQIQPFTAPFGTNTRS